MADPDVWIKAATKANGFKCYEMVLTHVDDVTSISEVPMRVTEGVKAVFKLKGDKAEVPNVHLGGSTGKATTGDGTECWTLSSEKCVKMAVSNVEESLAREGKKLPSKCLTPMVSRCHPSSDTSRELDSVGL